MDLAERRPDAGEPDAVLGAARAGERGFHRREVEVEDLGEHRVGIAVAAEEALLLRVALREVGGVAPTGEAQVADRLVVHREVRRGRAVLRAHVRERRAVGEGERGEAVAEELDELPHDAVAPEHLREHEDEVGRGRTRRERAARAHADHDGRRERHRLAEHRGLGLDAADAPAEDAEAVDHRRVRVRPDERVGERDAVAHRDDAREVLEVHLVADARAGRDDPQVLERGLRPPQERVALAVALVLARDVGLVGALDAEQVHLHRVVDDEVHRDERVDAGRVAARARDGGAHRGEVHDRRDAGVVLHEDPSGYEGDGGIARGLGPAREGRHVLVAHVARAGTTEEVLEEDLRRLRQARGVGDALLGEPGEPVVRDVARGRRERRARPAVRRHGLDRRSSSIALRCVRRVSRRIFASA